MPRPPQSDRAAEGLEMALHTPSAQHHVVPFPFEILGAVALGVLLTLGALLIAGHRDILPSGVTMPWEPRTYPAEVSQLEYRHGEQGTPWYSTGWQVQRQGEIAGD